MSKPSILQKTPKWTTNILVNDIPLYEPSRQSIPRHPDYTLKVFEALDPANDIN